MSERIFRIVLGATLLILLTLNTTMGIYVFMGILLFEGLTNWRIPILVSKARFGNAHLDHVNACGGDKFVIPFEAERMLRIVVLALLVFTYIYNNELFWWFPWFIGIMLCSAGLTGICPMVMMLRFIGFK